MGVEGGYQSCNEWRARHAVLDDRQSRGLEMQCFWSHSTASLQNFAFTRPRLLQLVFLLFIYRQSEWPIREGRFFCLHFVGLGGGGVLSGFRDLGQWLFCWG